MTAKLGAELGPCRATTNEKDRPVIAERRQLVGAFPNEKGELLKNRHMSGPARKGTMFSWSMVAGVMDAHPLTSPAVGARECSRAGARLGRAREGCPVYLAMLIL